MERLLIVNADDFGLSKGQNYGIIEACRLTRLRASARSRASCTHPASAKAWPT